MAYSPIVDFAAKDALAHLDPAKAVKGVELSAEFSAISADLALKLTIANLLAGILAVDGAGSGIDADNVDGVGPVAAGTYTPTLTNGANVAASTPGKFFYHRLGNTVFVHGTLQIDPTAAAPTASVIDISLPVASDLAASTDLSGTGSSIEAGIPTSEEAYRLSANTTNNRAAVSFYARTLTNHFVYVSFAYEVI